jgi:hypothetical protein
MLARTRDALARLPPAGAVARAYRRRPFLTAWVFLAAGMVLAVLVFGRDVGLTLGQHAALAGLCLPLAWLCTWIIFLEGGEGGEGDVRGAG